MDQAIQLMRYEICGEENQFVQIVLGPTDSVISDSSSLNWASSDIKAVQKPHLFSLSIYLGHNFHEKTSFLNCGTTDGYVCLSQRGCGRIHTIKQLDHDPSHLYILKDTFLCCNNSTTLINDTLPITSAYGYQNKRCPVWFASFSPIDSLVFVQSRGEIMSKTLLQNESILISYNSLVAIEPKCKITVMGMKHALSSVFTSKYEVFRIEGPGKLYFSQQREINIPKKRETLSLLASILHFISTLLILYFLTKFVIEIDFVEEGVPIVNRDDL
jgi:uncharacterized protein (AIM24 family)